MTSDISGSATRGRPASAGRWISIAIVGMGKIGRDQHQPVLSRSRNFSLEATVDPRGGIAGIENFDSLSDFLDGRALPDAVAICTPPRDRAQLAATCLRHGLHVLLEKPPAASLADVESLRRLAKERGRTLFAAWHSRFGPAVGTARNWLAGRTVASGHITWREDADRWHPGQDWIWQPGGFGVFDPGINAFSIVTGLIDGPLRVEAAELETVPGRSAPVSAKITIVADRAKITADMDFRERDRERWDIALRTVCGHELVLSKGGAALTVDGIEVRCGEREEYDALYDRFFALVSGSASDVDDAPLRLALEALEMGRVAR